MFNFVRMQLFYIPRMKKFLLLILLGVLIAPNLHAQFVDGKNLVTPSLHTNSTDLTKPFTLAIKFKIEKDWHLYWKNPGDAGFPPRITWQLPDGFSVGDLQFPTPHKIIEADLVAFGYSDELILLAEVTPPKQLPKALSISASIDWLVCKESCVPGNAKVSLDLSRLQPSDIEEANTLIARAKATLPTPLSQSTLQVEHALFDGYTLSLAFSGRDAKRILDFFPEPHDAFLYRFNEFKVENGKVIMPVTLQGAMPTSVELRGIVMLDEKGYEIQTSVQAASQISTAPQTERAQTSYSIKLSTRKRKLLLSRLDLPCFLRLSVASFSTLCLVFCPCSRSK